MFRVSLTGSVEGEAQQNSYSIDGSGSADRVTEEFKINFDLRGEYEHDSYDTDDGTEIYVNENYSANLLAVWSLGNSGRLVGRSMQTARRVRTVTWQSLLARR